MEGTNVAVVGAGIVGLTAAVQIQALYPNIKVTIITEEESPNTTGDGSAGLWGPYLLGDTPPHLIVKWSKETHEWLRALWYKGLASTAGITLQQCIRAIKAADGQMELSWSDIVYGFEHLSPDQLRRLNQEHSQDYSQAVSFTTFTCEPTIMLPYLTAQFRKKGGILHRYRVADIDELAGQYAAVINCSGLSARDIVPDRTVRPIRGQVARVAAPWQFYTFLDESADGNYIISNINSVVLGGTHQVDDSSRVVSGADSKTILNGCYNIIPVLKTAPILGEWVGLRPGRNSVRVELEHREVDGQPLVVVHNYGHGGAGITLSWGCAITAAHLLGEGLGLKPVPMSAEERPSGIRSRL